MKVITRCSCVSPSQIHLGPYVPSPCPPLLLPQALDSPEQGFIKNIISPVMLSLFLTSQFSPLYCNIPTSSSTYCNISHSLKIMLLGPQRLFQVLFHFSSLCYEKRLMVVHRSCSPFDFHFIQASAHCYSTQQSTEFSLISITNDPPHPPNQRTLFYPLLTEAQQHLKC